MYFGGLAFCNLDLQNSDSLKEESLSSDAYLGGHTRQNLTDVLVHFARGCCDAILNFHFSFFFRPYLVFSQRGLITAIHFFSGVGRRQRTESAGGNLISSPFLPSLSLSPSPAKVPFPPPIIRH